MVDFRKYKQLILYVVFIIFLFFYPNLTYSQESTRAQGWFCAKVTYCSGDDYIEGTCTLKHGHRVKLEVDPANRLVPNNDDTYLVECLSGVTDGQPSFICTTGSSNLDRDIFNVDNYSWLKTNWNYSLERDNNYGIFKVDNNQAVKIGPKEYKTGPSSGLILKENNEPVSVIEWQSYGYYEYNFTSSETRPGALDHKFYFFQKIQPQPTVEPGRGGQQQATSFDWINADQDCVVISWDPAGRVFDALSLEPIPGAEVFLTKDDGKGNFVSASQFELGIINPQLTDPQGGFSFFVSDGDYKLIIRNIQALGYERWTDNVNEINSRYNQIYYHLDSGVKKTFIYPAETGEVIKQRGKMEYRDIPLVPLGGVGKTYPLKVLSAFNSVQPSSGKMVFEGTVSHPFTQIIIYGVLTDNSEKGGQENQEKIYQGIADNLGNYKIVFSQENNEKTYVSFNVDFKKTLLTSLSQNLIDKVISWLKKQLTVFAQQNDSQINLRINPIPTYLEGVAYDDQGNILANAQVKVFVQGTNSPYSMVKTDNRGYFKIPSTHLPQLPYQLRYQNSAGKVVNVSTGKFIAQNRNLIESKKISFFSLRDNQGKLLKITPKINQSTVSLSQNWENDKNLTAQKKISPTKQYETSPSSLNSGTVLLLAMVLFLLVIIGVVVYFYLRQKRSSSMEV